MLSIQQESLKNWLNYAFSYFSIDISYKLPEAFILPNLCYQWLIIPTEFSQ